MRHLALLFAATLALAAVSTGCGGGDSAGALSAEDYFAEVAGLTRGFTTDSTDRAGDLTSELFGNSDIDDVRDLIETFFDDIEALYQGFLDDLDEIDPPDEVRDAHETAVDAAQETLDTLQSLSGDVGDIDDIGDTFSLLGDILNLSSDLGDACRRLEDAATGLDIDTDLDCP